MLGVGFGCTARLPRRHSVHTISYGGMDRCYRRYIDDTPQILPTFGDVAATFHENNRTMSGSTNSSAFPAACCAA